MTVKKTNNSVRNHATPILLSLFSAGLAGCSSVGTSTTDSATDSATDSTTDSTTSGVASKGLLNHAEVFIDVDGDGVWTSGVDSDKVRTEADGSFSIETNLTGDIVVQTDETTIDGSSGAVLAGVKMSAMAGSSVVTVATTLTNALVNSSGDTLSQADAEAQVKAILGLDASTDVSSYNAYAAENAGTAESIAFEKTAQQVMTIINTLAEAEATSSIGSDVSKSVALDKAVAAFVDVIEAKVAAAGSGTATAIDFKDADIITKVIDAAAVNDTSSIFATGAFIGDPLDTIKTAIQTVNKAIDAVTSLDASSKQIFSVAQSSLIDMTQAVASTNNATKASILSTTDISTLVVVKGATAGLTAEDAASVTDAGSLVLTGTALVADPNTADDVTYTFETTVVSIGSDSASGNPLGTLTITAEGVWTYTLNNNHAEIQALGASDSLVEVFQIKTLASDAAINNPDGSTKFISVRVLGSNDAPTLSTAIVAQTIAEDSVFSLTIPSSNFADVDTGDTSTLTATLEGGAALPSWLTFIPDTGVLSGAPTNDEVGSINITVTSTDASTVSVSDTFSLTVANINDAPRVANALVDQSLISGREGTYSIATDSFYDIDAGETATLTYTATPIPTWGSFDEDTLTFTATPPDIDSVVSVVVTVTATDTTGATVSSTFIVTVMANQAPLVATLGDQTATEDTEVNFTLADSNFTDGNGDAMVVSVSGNPDWLKFDANTKTFSGTPTINNEAGTSTIIVTATDASNTTGTATFDLVTTAANDAPVFTSAPSVNVTENSFTAATVAVSDEESDTMTYSLSGTDASSFSIDSSTGKLSFVGTPRTDMVMLLDSSGNSGALLADNYTSTTTDSVTQVTMDLYVLPKAGDAESLAGFQFNQISSDSAADMSIVNDSTIGGAFTNNGAKSIWYDTSASNSLGAVKIGTITIANYDATETYSIETIKMLGGDDGTTTSPKLVTNDLIISSVTDLPVANSTYSVDVTATDSNDSTSSATQTLAITVDATATNPNSSTSTATWTGTAGTDTYTIDSLTASSADGGNGDNDVVKISIENHTRWDTTGGTSDLVATLVDMEIIDIGNVISSNDSSPVVIGDFSTNMIINSTSAASMVAGADSQVSIMGTTNDIVTLSGTTWAKSSSSSSSLSSGDYSSQVLDAWSDGSSTTLHIDQEINIVTPDIV